MESIAMDTDSELRRIIIEILPEDPTASPILWSGDFPNGFLIEDGLLLKERLIYVPVGNTIKL